MIDELNQVRRLLLEGGGHFSVAIDDSDFMLWCINEKTKEVSLNKPLLDFMGESKDKSLSSYDLRLSNIHKNDIEAYLAMLHNALQKQVHYIAEYRLMNAVGRYIWIKEEGIPIFFRGEVSCQGFICGCIDINTLKKAQLSLGESEERYRRLFEAARDGILILNSKNGQITDVNPYLTRLLGYSKEELLGLSIWELGAFKNIRASKEAFKTLQEVGYVKYDDLPLETKDGRLISVGFVSNAYIANEERVIQCNIRDLSEQKRIDAAEKSLALFQQEKIKASFIADVTHELRTPLAVIKGNVELALRDNGNTKKTKEVYEAINIEVDHLAGILYDLAILTNEKQSVSHTLEKEEVDISKVISRVVMRLKQVSQKRNITIETHLAEGISLHSNKKYLEKLFSNIICNAIFYGKDKGIVSVNTHTTGKNIEIIVKDNGIGIPKEELSNIFERFYRTEKAREVNHDGTGLGLPISKHIVEAHGGTIAIESKESTGTTVTIALPIT